MTRSPTDAAEPPSFDVLYEQHMGFVWRNARRLGVSPADLDDVVQDVFLVVQRRLGEFEARSSIETWLFGILWKISQHYRRSMARGRRKIEALGRLEDPSVGLAVPDALDHVTRLDEAAYLHALLDTLSDEKRVVFLLVALEEQSVPEVASLLNVNVNTVYSRLRAARIELQRALMREPACSSRSVEPDSTPAASSGHAARYEERCQGTHREWIVRGPEADMAYDVGPAATTTAPARGQG
jgi:RNA polymerase sigma-70 factor (ECF subfamily)